MSMPHFTNTLLFRISATFLLLIGLGLGSYYLWIEETLFNPYASEAEEDWYNNRADDELLDLAKQLALVVSDSTGAETLLISYRKSIEEFEVELIFFDTSGQARFSSDPDSLSAEVGQVSAELISNMNGDDWDFEEFPDAVNIDAYINRIFSVEIIIDGQNDEILGYLVASYFPSLFISDDLNSDVAMLNAQDKMFKAVVALLIYSAISALFIMARTSRRVKRLSDGVHAIATGDLSHRVPARSADEIGTLGRNFNSMAEHLESMMEQLRNKEEFQRQLIANVSHDLRTPLASIRGYVETLQMKGSAIDRAKQDRYLKIIDGNIHHLSRLVEHMLVLSRFDSGQATFHMEVFSIVELVDSIEERLSGLMVAKNVILNIACEDSVGLVRGDPLQIAQVLQNLVENGIKFSDPTDTITVSLSCQSERVTIKVIDTGCGINAEDLPRIFDRFFTCNTSRTRINTNSDGPRLNNHLYQGSGLGLAIAAKIIAGHNGILRVDSQVGQGSTFWFELDHITNNDPESAGNVYESEGKS